jgi:hypothetical protein
LLNGGSCGRVHCRIDGIAFPLLAIVGALNVLSTISFDWNLFWLAFFVLLSGLRSGMELEEVHVMVDMAGADDVRNYPG